MEITNLPFDVAIIGGGPAGAATSIHLRRLGRRVILFEESNYDVPRIGETLAPSIRPVLSELVSWDSFLETAPIPSNGTKSAWGGNDLMSTSFIFTPYRTGWHIDRQKFDEMICDFAAEEGAIVFTSSPVVDIIPQGDIEDGWIIISPSIYKKIRNKGIGVSCKEISFQARSIINATGRSPFFIQKTKARQIVYDRLVGIAARFKDLGKAIESFTLIEASEEGWWYSAPLPNGASIAVLMTDGDIMARNHLNHKEEWMKYFNKTEHTKARFIGCNIIEEPRIFSASSRMLSRNTYENMWMAVGDAALAVDPLSAGGILYALKSSRNVANALDQWLSGDSSTARSYDAQIDKDWHHYLNKRAFYYNLETRWPEALFWKRRRFINLNN